jgi:hypothetical protein
MTGFLQSFCSTSLLAVAVAFPSYMPIRSLLYPNCGNWTQRQGFWFNDLTSPATELYWDAWLRYIQLKIIATLSLLDGNTTATTNKLVEPNDCGRKLVVYYPLYDKLYSLRIEVNTGLMIEKSSGTQFKAAVVPAWNVSLVYKTWYNLYFAVVNKTTATSKTSMRF